MTNTEAPESNDNIGRGHMPPAALLDLFKHAPASRMQLQTLRSLLAERDVAPYAAVRIFEEVRIGITAVRADELIAELRDAPVASEVEAMVAHERAMDVLSHRAGRLINEYDRDSVEAMTAGAIGELLSLALAAGLDLDEVIAEARGRVAAAE